MLKGKHLRVVLTAFAGDPDLYMSRASSDPSALPNQTSYEWASTLFRGDTITVPTSDPRLCSCTYIIGVFGFSASSFSLLATSTESIQLQVISSQ